MNRRWAEYFKSKGWNVLLTDCKSGSGVNQFAPMVRSALKDKIARWEEKGMGGKAMRAMVIGVPNVGKSTFINQVAGRKSAKAQNKPGVTRGKQWITVDRGLELLDTPGILWPKFEDQSVGYHLAYTGAVKDAIMDLETLSSRLMGVLAKRYPEAITARYKIAISPEMQDWELLEAAGRKRGFLISGGEVDLERMARVLLEEYRSGKLGRFTLETPEDL
jgi:ribosome biogenesis GTPase A